MLHLRHYTSFFLNTRSSSSIINKKNSIFLSGSRILVDNELLEFKNCSRRNGSLNAVDKDSDFEVDPDKAREALRQLDEQLQSLSKKQVSPPKIRAMDLNEPIIREREEEISGFTGSFLVFAASGLLVFTILYNILFFTVIKPSIDGPQAVESASMIREAEERASIKELSRSAEFSVRR